MVFGLQAGFGLVLLFSLPSFYAFDFDEFWIINEVEINNTFSPYFSGFNYSVIDHPQLRNLIQPNNSLIKRLSDDLTVNLTSDLEVVQVFYSYVHDNIDYHYENKLISASEVLVQGRGDCTGMSVLLTSLLRSKGFDAYTHYGVKHSYVALKLNDSWIGIDPMMDGLDFVFNHRINDSVSDDAYFIDDSFQPFIFNENETLMNSDWLF